MRFQSINHWFPKVKRLIFLSLPFPPFCSANQRELTYVVFNETAGERCNFSRIRWRAWWSKVNKKQRCANSLKGRIHRSLNCTKDYLKLKIIIYPGALITRLKMLYKMILFDLTLNNIENSQSEHFDSLWAKNTLYFKVAI